MVDETGRLSMTTTSPTGTITTMRRRHLRNVRRIEEQTSSTPWSLGLFLAEVRRDERDYIVALSDDDERVLGFAGLLYVVGEGHVTTVSVDPKVQRGRIGTRLMLELARRSITRDSNSITL